MVAAIMLQGVSSVELAAGTEIELMVLTEVSASRSKVGDPIKMRINKPVMAGDVTVLPAGTPAFGTVVAAKRSGIAFQRGTLTARMSHLSVNGVTVPIEGELFVRAKGGAHDDVLKAVIAPLHVLFAANNSAKLKAGDLVVAKLSRVYAAGEAAR